MSGFWRNLFGGATAATLSTVAGLSAADMVTEARLTVGQELVLESPSPERRYVAVFEDDGATGYFYALDMTKTDQPIQDALNIYDVKSVLDGNKPSVVKIVWASDANKVALLINDYPHAVFDFSTRRGYCRTGFPDGGAGSGWSRPPWDDAMLAWLR